MFSILYAQVVAKERVKEPFNARDRLHVIALCSCHRKSELHWNRSEPSRNRTFLGFSTNQALPGTHERNAEKSLSYLVRCSTRGATTDRSGRPLDSLSFLNIAGELAFGCCSFLFFSFRVGACDLLSPSFRF